MIRRYTFGEVVLIYQRVEDQHRLLTDLDTENPRNRLQEIAGPWTPLDNPITYEWNGRCFLGQAIAPVCLN
jgi:hypothetical protein